MMSQLRTSRTDPDLLLAQEIETYVEDPLGYVIFAFPWNTDPSIQQVRLKPRYKDRFGGLEYGPDEWACEFLDDLGTEIKQRGFSGKGAVSPIRFSTASGHGIGKSAMVAWLIKYILDSRPMSMGVVTANTSEQLRTKTWAEVAKWNSLSITSHLWNYTNSRGMMSISRIGSKAIQQKWRCDAMTCREENSEAFQGLHAAGSTPFYIFDEASGIPDKIFEARSGGATDGEPMWFDFGNPTRKSGYFFENTAGSKRHRFNTRSIDSRTVQITGKELFAEWAADYGEDSDFFKVKVKGEFPSAGSVQFIANDLVQAAMLRPPVQNPRDPLCIGVDVARFGSNSTVIFARVGMDARSFGFKEYRGLGVDQVVEKVIEVVQDFRRLGRKCDGLFVDGGGLGGGVVDILRRLGYNPMDVSFGGRSSDAKYRIKADEMWGKMRDALETMAIPNSPALMAQLTQREYGFTSTGKIALESKDVMKKRLGEDASPDIADALALTFASTPATDLDAGLLNASPIFAQSDYDPLEARF